MFLIFVLTDSDLPHGETIAGIGMLTVASSFVLHTMSAAPFPGSYAKRADYMGDCEQKEMVSESSQGEGDVKIQ